MDSIAPLRQQASRLFFWSFWLIVVSAWYAHTSAVVLELNSTENGITLEPTEIYWEEDCFVDFR